MLFLLLVLFVIDGLLTYLIIKRGGRELNPVMKALIAKMGLIPALVLPKLLLLVLVIQFPDSQVWLAAIYAAAVGWMALQAKKAGVF